jgi:hypothetical protein
MCAESVTDVSKVLQKCAGTVTPESDLAPCDTFVTLLTQSCNNREARPECPPLLRQAQRQERRRPGHHLPRCTTSSNGRRFGFLIGFKGLSAG